ncbi:hypothetical protein CAPTEDRAFT_222450 [Capitella teleta]|uniref:Dynein axonemal assembly factor 4 n=1 Tax=Capitella teleta TaxID=283909 RepID=R7VII6_CAPTE|nr:hypothetical protein CAPTEDRAFT_222450 [Capitella teleta]|eukprot:ELU18434.1 hypothetical protein CAPTEDRAFT_222450 [Capitella teleta]
MPIAVKDYTWEETPSMLYITVPLKGVQPQKVDILSTERYIKVHYTPFFFECFLNGEVFDQKSAAQVGNGAIVFKLEKQENRMWEELQCAAAGNKKEEMLLRETAQARLRERNKEEQKQKEELKREHDRFGVKQQMRIEDDDHKRIASAKESERVKATEELEKWKQQQTQMALIMREKEEKQKAELNSQTLIHKKKKASEIFEEAAGNNPMRDPGKINVSFTPRVFPTAARESQAANEEEVLL